MRLTRKVTPLFKLTFIGFVAALILIIDLAETSTSKNHNNDDTPGQLQVEVQHHLLVVASFFYSHCLEVFGVALTLVDSGKFKATVFVHKACRALATRMLEVTRYPDRIRTIDSSMTPETVRSLTEMMSGMETTSLLTNTSMSGAPTKDELQVIGKMVKYSDEFFAQDNFSVAHKLHLQTPFDVAICDAFSSACYEFADQQEIVGIKTGVQGPPSPSDIEHNGLWLAACPRVKLNDQCGLWNRIITFYDYIFPFDIPFARRRIKDDFLPFLYEVSVDARIGRPDLPPIRPHYPHIDQQVLGTNKPIAYYRADHAIVGPTWFKLHQQELNTSHPLTAWVERASKPVVYVSFGTVAQLNKTEYRIILEGIVSDRWQTIWKTNVEMVQEIRNNKRSGDEKSDNILSTRMRALANDPTALQIVDWAPQFALLRHPKVKAFVTHGGMGSTMEAYATATPVICVPIFGDQPYNCKQAEGLGVGVMVTKAVVSSKTLHEAIERVLLNGSEFSARAAEIAQYHAAVDTTGRLADFVGQYAQFRYQFSEIADDRFDILTYWNLDLWAFVVAIVIGVSTLRVSMAFMLLLVKFASACWINTGVKFISKEKTGFRQKLE